MPRTPNDPPPSPPVAAPLAPVPRIDSQRLLGGAPELLIDHHGVIYRLRQTALGKLILTK